MQEYNHKSKKNYYIGNPLKCNTVDDTTLKTQEHVFDAHDMYCKMST